MSSRPTGKHAAGRPAPGRPSLRTGAARGGRHRAPATRSPLADAAPRVLGVAALALATTGTVSAATLPSTAASSSAAPTVSAAADQPRTADLATSVVGAVHATDTVRAPSVVERMRVQRVVRVSRDAPRRTAGTAEAAEAEEAAAELAANTWHLPLAAGSYRLSSTFGECSALWSQCHTGLDLAAPAGTPVLSVAGGVVTETSYAGAYGNRTIVTLEDGTDIWYCLQSAFGAKVGDQVVGGQPIGFVGTTGNSTGPHLHLEVRPGGGDAVDPFRALTVHGLQP